MRSKSIGALLIGIVMFLLCQELHAARSPLTPPNLDIELGDTKEDLYTTDPDTGNEIAVDSEATVSFDEGRGAFVFEYKPLTSKSKNTIVWPIASRIEMTVELEVHRESSTGALIYIYEPDVATESKQMLQHFILEIGGEDTRSVNPDSLWKEKKWTSRRITRSWGGDFWSWARIYPGLTMEERASPGQLSLVSVALPKLAHCWARGIAPEITAERADASAPWGEVPYSIEKALSKHNDIFVDAAKGVTVAPGLETVELPALMLYFETSIEQGWMETGAYRDEVKALLTSALSAHEQRKTAQVLRTLTSIQEKVSAVYAQGNSPMLSEAYALLHFNIDYLLANYEKDLAVKDVAE